MLWGILGSMLCSKQGNKKGGMHKYMLNGMPKGMPRWVLIGRVFPSSKVN